MTDRRAPRESGHSSPAGPAQRLPMLMYHEIAAEPVGTARLAVRPDDFARQLDCLAEAGYTTVHAADVAAAMAGATSLPARAVVLTFDDGFADFHETALPALLRHGYTATLYVTTGWVAQTGEPGRRTARAAQRPPGMLSWSQIGEASAAGIEIGAHTEHHPELDQLPASSVGQELRGSKNLLEERLGIPVTGMSYPFGYSNRSVRVAAGAAGYQHACAVRNRYARGTDDVLALPRLTIGRPTGLNGFARIVGGHRLPAEFVAYRGLTMGWSVVRHARSAARWLKQRE